MKSINALIRTKEGYPIHVEVKKLTKDRRLRWYLEDRLVLVLKGNIEINMKDGVHSIREDDILLINRGTLYKVLDISRDNIVLVITVNPEDFTAHFPDINKIELSLDTSKEANEEIVREIRGLLGSIVISLLERKEIHELMIVALLQKFMGVMVQDFTRSYNRKPLDLLIAERDRLTTILDYIDENIKVDISLTELSEKLDLNPNYLSRFIKDQLGSSLTTYTNSRRVEMFIKLMENADKTMTELSYEAGFSNPKQMNKVFKKFIGMTPTEYKKLHYDDQDVNIQTEKESKDIIFQKVSAYVGISKVK